MNWEGAEVVRSALGRVGFLGELYDLRSETFSCRSIFKSQVPKNLVQNVEVMSTSFDYKFTEGISDRFELLNVEAEIQVSILCGLLEVGGSGKFLSEEKRCRTSIACSLICKFKTVCEKVFGSFNELVSHLDLSALSDPQYTHVIMETNWGANCLLNLEKSYSLESEKKKVEGLLGAEVKKLSKLISVKGKGEVEYDEGNLLKKNDISIKVCADVTPQGKIPTSVNSFCNFLSDIPDLLKKINGGKGIPLSYVMVPLSALRKSAGLECNVETVIKSVDESFLISIVCLFEEIATVKQSLDNMAREIIEYENYLSKEEVIKCKNQVEKLRLREVRLKSIIASDWVQVRSGNKTLRDLIMAVEKFKSIHLNLCSFEEYLTSSYSVRAKIASIKNYLSYGVEYLARGQRFTDYVNKNLNLELIILLVSNKFDASDPALYQNVCCHFLALASKGSIKSKFIVVDLDVDASGNDCGGSTNASFFSKIGIENVRCVRMKGTKILNADLYSEYLSEQQMNFARLMEGSEIENFQHKPGNRTALEIACPGFRGGCCGPDRVKWSCFRCKKNLEYGFDQYFYCFCGRGASSSYEYRCSVDSHGATFVSADSEFLKDQLSTLRAFKELNILILGQSGVGKSTWINSIVNYLNYETLDEAKKNGVVCTIPIKFTAYDRETAEEHVIEIGGNKDGEVTETGASGTRFCSTYTFAWEDRYVRLIDTPGLGDTRGIDQDKQNMRNIIDHIGYLKELHGVCILLKANDCRISAIFSYCLKELLVHMHKSIAKNIVFCFTNARNSFYTPGQTSSLLEKQLSALEIEKDLALGHHNRFCLDNEAFLFLCTLQHSGIRHDDSLVRSFAQSWDISLNETRRLFSTIKTFRPHSLQNTLSLFTARNRILSLSKPIAEISKTIQMNLATTAKRREDLNASEKTLEELSKKLFVSEIHLEPVRLTLPRTVCTSSKCVEYHKIETLDITEVEYKTHCHKECYLENIQPKAVNNALLMDCLAMSNGICTFCGCGWQYHMHINFDQKRVQKKCVNKAVESNLLKEKSDKEKIEEFIQILQAKIEKYQKEQDFIIQVSVKFGVFLKENAITVYNDAVADYLAYLIEEEENKPAKTKNDQKLLRNLKDTLNHYNAEIKVLQKVVSQGEGDSRIPTLEEIHEMEQKLYALELCGEDIKKNVEANRSSRARSYMYSETHLKIPNQTPSTKKSGNWWRWFTG